MVSTHVCEILDLVVRNLCFSYVLQICSIIIVEFLTSAFIFYVDFNSEHQNNTATADHIQLKYGMSVFDNGKTLR